MHRLRVAAASVVGWRALLLGPLFDMLKDLIARRIDELHELHADRITLGVFLLAPVNDASFDERRARKVAETAHDDFGLSRERELLSRLEAQTASGDITAFDRDRFFVKPAAAHRNEQRHLYADTLEAPISQ